MNIPAATPPKSIKNARAWLKQKTPKQIREKTVSVQKKGFVVVVLLPTLISALYFYFMASDRYVAHARFSVSVEDDSMAPLQEAGMMIPVMGTSTDLQESFVVQEFIQSRRMLSELEKEINLRSLYSTDRADIFSRLSRKANNETFLQYFRDMAEIRIDEHTSVLQLNVQAFRAEDAKLIADEVLNQAELFVNSMSNRVRDDAISFARQELESAEKAVQDNNSVLADFRNEKENFDPKVTAETVVRIVAGMEASLAAVEAEISNLENYMRPSSPRLQGLQNRANSLRKQIAVQSRRLADKDGAALATDTFDYTALEAQANFALKRYEIALVSLEAAQADARKKNTYLLRIEEPILPDVAMLPARSKQVGTTLLVSLLIYFIGGVLLTSIREHARP